MQIIDQKKFATAILASKKEAFVLYVVYLEFKMSIPLA